MAHYMILAAYKADVLRELVMNPELILTREQHMESFYGGMGARVVAAFFMRDAEHHFVAIVDFPDERTAAGALVVALASSTFENVVMRRLVTLEDAVEDYKRGLEVGAKFFRPGGSPGEHIS